MDEMDAEENDLDNSRNTDDGIELEAGKKLDLWKKMQDLMHN